jgi:hypothetical protein
MPSHDTSHQFRVLGLGANHQVYQSRYIRRALRLIRLGRPATIVL